nr:hypothetical protein [Kibdelosporangium sp. MJ126-NF4]
MVNDDVERDAEDSRLTGAQRDYHQAASGVLADLARLGLPVQVVQHLYQLELNFGPPVGRKRIDYRVAVPALVDWLPRVSYPPLALDILNAVSYGFAKPLARPVLVPLFRDTPQDSPFTNVVMRGRLGLVLGAFTDPSVSDEYIEIALDRGQGEGRAGIVAQLPKTKDERVPDVLLGLLDDPTVAPAAIEALGRIRHLPAKPHLERALHSEDWNVRTQAKKALKRLG